jgi:two-component system, OmpR family, sensor histidine kinase SenX3
VKADECEVGRELHRDVTRQLDRMALLAHQLMTPLSTISSLAQGLMRRTSRLSADDIQERSEKIWRASLRLQELIETIMSYTRINTGAVSPNLNLFNLETLLRRVCHDQRRQEPDRPFSVDLQDIPDLFVGDPVLLEQALVIILSNAAKYSQAHQPIGVTGRCHNGKIVVKISDEGMGVPEADIPYLTQPFYRGQNARHMTGTGLGLSLAWHILTLHGGSLHIESREGSGTTVTILLPGELMTDFGSDLGSEHDGKKPPR